MIGQYLCSQILSEGVAEVSAAFPDRAPGFRKVLAPLVHRFWTILLIVTLGTLAAFPYAQMQVPQHEATAVVQVQAGTDAASVAGHVLSRDSLLSVATRHGLFLASARGNRDKIAVLMREAVSINDLRSEAGATLGYPAQVAGVVVSVLLPDVEASARVANDLAQQILDDGNAGKLDENQEELDFYRRDELRLWEEVSALQTAQDQTSGGTAGQMDAAIAGRRRLMLMQDQYDLVRQKLAEEEISSRLARHLLAGQFSLLRRATAGEAVTVVQNWMLAGVAGSLLLAVSLAFLLDRLSPGLRRGPLPALRDRVAHLYRQFDDPARPILGVPRYMVTTALTVVWLYLLAGFIR